MAKVHGEAERVGQTFLQSNMVRLSRCFMGGKKLQRSSVVTFLQQIMVSSSRPVNELRRVQASFVNMSHLLNESFLSRDCMPLSEEM